AAALRYLGPGYRFLTVLYADGPVRSGVLHGNLVLYGTGDPTFGLDTAALAPFADSVVRAGIRRVRGDVIGDASFLGAELRGPGWDPDDFDRPWAAPAAALGAAENRIRIRVTPAARAGQPATVEVEPANDYYHVSSAVITARRGSLGAISLRRGRARGVVEVFGAIAVGSSPWNGWVVVDEPAVYAAGMLRRLLAARGVEVSGATRSVSDAAEARAQQMLRRSSFRGDPFRGAIAVRRSEPLEQIVTMINHRSHNLSAELVLRSIGRMVSSSGTFASGARAVARFLVDSVGIHPDQVLVSDGSGLSLLDQATPRSLVQLLAWMHGARGGETFVRSLPLMGEGPRRRLAHTEAAGRVRAKTGTLDRVSALAGYVTAANGEELAFAVIANDTPSIAHARRTQDSLAVMLARLSREVPRRGRATPRR
ncbi:MAG TPA: D-alanyl-D-alanine carboxypeptidase/D-alanyl-D-alanine-endopeptidase, partial [Gemmatimonadales bacterium]|nr:D-alanyl-D-alanine carboxypeptidase/D-alanyl-D-alanine-endopeptidase [Gemmatimonadales bacterium]